VIARLPGQARPSVGMITGAAFTTGLNRILLVAAVIALVSGVVSLAAIRGRDFALQQGPGSPGRSLKDQIIRCRTGRGITLPQLSPSRGAYAPDGENPREWRVIGLGDDVCGFLLFPRWNSPA
jgi:hypothetical protein